MRSKLLLVVDAHTKFKVCSCSHSGNMDKIPKFKSRSRWPRLCHLWPTFVPLIFYSLQSIYVLNLKPIASAVREIPFDLVFCMPCKLHLMADAHTKFQVSSFSHSNDTAVGILNIWASFAILDSTLSGFHNSASFTEPQSTISYPHIPFRILFSAFCIFAFY